MKWPFLTLTVITALLGSELKVYAQSVQYYGHKVINNDSVVIGDWGGRQIQSDGEVIFGLPGLTLYDVNSAQITAAVGSYLTSTSYPYVYAPALVLKLDTGWKLSEFKIPAHYPPIQSINTVNDSYEMIASGGFKFLRNGLPVDLNNRVTGWNGFHLVDVNNKGMIIGTGYKLDSNGQSTGQQKPILLLPVEVIPNFDRNETIDLTGSKDRGKVTEEKPWRWWINDDSDNGDVANGDSDVPDSLPIVVAGPYGTTSVIDTTNHSNYKVDGRSDLVDFFPLFIDLKQMIEVLPPDASIQYKLKHEEDAFGFVYTDLTPEQADDFLIEDEQSGYGPNFTQPANDATVTKINAAGVVLNTAFLNKIKDDGKGVLLFEASKATDKPLVLEVTKGGQKLTEVKFFIKTSKVEEMFRHKDIRNAVQRWDGFVPGRNTQLLEPENYPDDLCSTKNFVFVHGYNVNGEQARGWNAEAFKRMFQSGSKARFYGVSWCGDRNQKFIVGLGRRTTSFHAAVNDAFASAHDLATFVNGLSGDTTLAAHSLGNLVATSAQSDWGMSVKQYYMVNAALSLESVSPSALTQAALLHFTWQDYPENVTASEWYLNFTEGDSRHKLTWRGRVENYSGARYNFYSDVSGGLGDHVMRTPPNTGDDDLTVQLNTLLGAFVGGDSDGQYTFCLQERLKGKFLSVGSSILGSDYGGWQFSQNFANPPGDTTSQANPDEAEDMTTTELRYKPVFDPGYVNGAGNNRTLTGHAPAWMPDLTNPTTAQSIATQHRNHLLSEVFPARTLAVGGNRVQIYGDNNIDMQSACINGWPSQRTAGDEPISWWHGDLKDVAYCYVYKLFEKWCELGALDE